MPVRLIPFQCLLLSMAGCTTMYVGHRFGFVEPVSRPAPTVQLAEHTQTGFGVIGGLWFGMKISDRVSLEVRSSVGFALAFPATSIGLTAGIEGYIE